jgi:hypothetical protein
MLLRVRDFGAAHQEQFPESSAGARAFADVARIVGSIEDHATKKIVAVREGRRVKNDRRKLMLDRMKTIARSSRGIQSETGGPLRLRMPDRTSDIAILTAARAFLREAEPYHAQLVELGLPASYFAELRQTADAFAEALTEHRTGRSDVAGAQAGITAGIKEGSATARRLDIIVANVLGGDPVAMAAWARDRKLVTGEPKRTADTPKAEVSTPTTPVVQPPVVIGTTAAPGVVEPAAAPPDPLRRAS